MRVAQEVVRAGQQHRDGPRLGHRRDAGLVQMLQVIGGQGAIAGRQRGAAEIAQLFGMQLDRQAMPVRGLEHALGLRRREADALAERIDRIDQSFLRQCRQHGVADQRDVVVGAIGVFGRQGMRAEEGRVHGHAIRLPEPPRDAQLLALGGEVQAVARFDLDRGDALGQQRLEPRRGLREQRVFVGGAGGPHGRHDAAAGACDFLVAGAGEPHRELVGTLAAIDQMRVAVDQAGRDPRAVGIVVRQAAVSLGKRGVRAEPSDATLLDNQRGIADGVGRIGIRQQMAAMPDAVGGRRVGHAGVDGEFFSGLRHDWVSLSEDGCVDCSLTTRQRAPSCSGSQRKALPGGSNKPLPAASRSASALRVSSLRQRPAST